MTQNNQAKSYVSISEQRRRRQDAVNEKCNFSDRPKKKDYIIRENAQYLNNKSFLVFISTLEAGWRFKVKVERELKLTWANIENSSKLQAEPSTHSKKFMECFVCTQLKWVFLLCSCRWESTRCCDDDDGAEMELSERFRSFLTWMLLFFSGCSLLPHLAVLC